MWLSGPSGRRVLGHEGASLAVPEPVQNSGVTGVFSASGGCCRGDERFDPPQRAIDLGTKNVVGEQRSNSHRQAGGSGEQSLSNPVTDVSRVSQRGLLGGQNLKARNDPQHSAQEFPAWERSVIIVDSAGINRSRRERWLIDHFNHQRVGSSVSSSSNPNHAVP